MDEPNIIRASLPKGYSFVPKGNVFITGNCRRYTQAASSIVYLVFNDRGMKKKIGIGVPTNIYLRVQLDERNTRTERASNVLKRDKNIAKEFEKAILESFPQIPSSEVNGVLVKALEKGKGKVGRTSTLDIASKAILAVRAYIRHQHTDYEMLLRGGMDRDEARKEVEAKVRETVKAWSRLGSRVPIRKARKQQLLQTTLGKRTVTSPKPHETVTKRAQAGMSKPRLTDRQLIDPPACSLLSSEPDSTAQSERDAAPADSAMQRLGEMRCKKILDLLANIQGIRRKLGNSDSKRNTKRRNLIMKHSKTVNKLLEEAGLQRVDTSGAREELAKQLRLIAPDPAGDPQVTTSGQNSTQQMKTRRSSPWGKPAVKRQQEVELENTGNADDQREPLNKTKIVIDLTGDSDDDLVSIHANMTTQKKRNREAVRVHVVAGERDFDATARELQRELRELNVGGTGQALPRKRHAAVEAARILSKRSHSREAKVTAAPTPPR